MSAAGAAGVPLTPLTLVGGPGIVCEGDSCEVPSVMGADFANPSS